LDAKGATCPSTPDTSWEEWKHCQSLALSRVRSDETFDDFIVRNGPQLPWTLHSNHTAILLEFRSIHSNAVGISKHAINHQSRICFTINNTLMDLPVHWRSKCLAGSLRAT